MYQITTEIYTHTTHTMYICIINTHLSLDCILVYLERHSCRDENMYTYVVYYVLSHLYMYTSFNIEYVIIICYNILLSSFSLLYTWSFLPLLSLPLAYPQNIPLFSLLPLFVHLIHNGARLQNLVSYAYHSPLKLSYPSFLLSPLPLPFIPVYSLYTTYTRCVQESVQSDSNEAPISIIFSLSSERNGF